MRNSQAAINLKAMKAGDRCFFYHSGEGKEIVGIAEVVKTAYPDPTDKDGKAVTVDVKAVQPVEAAGDAGRHQGRSQVQGVQAGAPVAALGRAGQRRALEASSEDVRDTQVIDNTRGILAMSASVVVFIFNDALIKLAAETMPPVQAIGVRGVFATLWCALALLVSGDLAADRMAAPSARAAARRARGGGGHRLPGGAVPHSLRHRHRGQPLDAAGPHRCWPCCC